LEIYFATLTKKTAAPDVSEGGGQIYPDMKYF